MSFPPCFETLEARKLLASANVAVAHHRASAVASSPIQLDGTLTVETKAATMIENDDGSSTTTTPVSGRLGVIGKVRGIWSESTDQFGEPTGNDTLRLHNAQGTVVIELGAKNTGRATSAGQETVSYERTQQLVDVPGAYAHNSEKGTIELITNKGKSGIVSMVVDTKS